MERESTLDIELVWRTGSGNGALSQPLVVSQDSPRHGVVLGELFLESTGRRMKKNHFAMALLNVADNRLMTKVESNPWAYFYLERELAVSPGKRCSQPLAYDGRRRRRMPKIRRRYGERSLEEFWCCPALLVCPPMIPSTVWPPFPAASLSASTHLSSASFSFLPHRISPPDSQFVLGPHL